MLHVIAHNTIFVYKVRHLGKLITRETAQRAGCVHHLASVVWAFLFYSILYPSIWYQHFYTMFIHLNNIIRMVQRVGSGHPFDFNSIISPCDTNMRNNFFYNYWYQCLCLIFTHKNARNCWKTSSARMKPTFQNTWYHTCI